MSTRPRLEDVTESPFIDTDLRLTPAEVALAVTHGLISAIKAYRTRTNASLPDAKAAVEQGLEALGLATRSEMRCENCSGTGVVRTGFRMKFGRGAYQDLDE